MVYGVVPTKNRFLGGPNISKIWHGVGPTRPGVSSEKKFIPQIPEELAETNQGLTDKKWWFDEHTLIFELPRIAPFNRQTLGDLINQATYTSNQPKSAIFFSSSPGILGWFFIGKIEMGLKLGVSHSISWFTWKMAIPLYYWHVTISIEASCGVAQTLQGFSIYQATENQTAGWFFGAATWYIVMIDLHCSWW